MGEQAKFCRRLFAGAFCPGHLDHFNPDFRHFLNRHRIRATGMPAESPVQVVDCPICGGLERAFETTYVEYVEARQSASYRFCTKFAARKKVDMERARYEMEEHEIECASGLRLTDALPSPSIRDSIDSSDCETEELFQLA